MNKDHVQTLLNKIQADASRRDNESAHMREDTLYINFIHYVSENAPENIAEIAKLVLTAEEIDFTRWYA